MDLGHYLPRSLHWDIERPCRLRWRLTSFLDLNAITSPSIAVPRPHLRRPGAIRTELDKSLAMLRLGLPAT